MPGRFEGEGGGRVRSKRLPACPLCGHDAFVDDVDAGATGIGEFTCRYCRYKWRDVMKA